VPIALSSLAAADLRAWLAERGQPAYRERQLRSWLARGAAGFEEMRDLPGSLRVQLADSFRASSLEEIARSEIAADQTTKYLYRLDGGYTVEGGESKEETQWFRISAWNQLAERCSQYLTKGQGIPAGEEHEDGLPVGMFLETHVDSNQFLRRLYGPTEDAQRLANLRVGIAGQRGHDPGRRALAPLDAATGLIDAGGVDVGEAHDTNEHGAPP